MVRQRLPWKNGAVATVSKHSSPRSIGPAKLSAPIWLASGSAAATITVGGAPPIPSIARCAATARGSGARGIATTGSDPGRTTRRWPSETGNGSASEIKNGGSAVLPTTTWFSI